MDLFKNNKCFKLVCGAGNEDAIEVEKLVALYSKAGCNFFDLSAKPEIVEAAKKGLEIAGIKEDRYLCVSVGIQGDPHVSKASIDTEKCVKCGKCSTQCLQQAIKENASSYKIKKMRCIGCGKCAKICPKQCIEMTSEFIDLKITLPPIIQSGIDCIEFHAIGEDEIEVAEKWEDINNLFDGVLSICIDRSKLGNEKLLKRVNQMLLKRKPHTTIIQADGAPMSGGEDDFKTTLQAIATAEIFQNENLPIYLLLSGGTNSKTTLLAKQCNINAGGIAIGSYARKIVKKYIEREDFLKNEEIFNKALTIAKELVETSLEHL
ncbi:MAG: LdpA C-terminal domain-containing domain [Candidatus Gastranaerophilales bacterium]